MVTKLEAIQKRTRPLDALGQCFCVVRRPLFRYDEVADFAERG